MTESADGLGSQLRSELIRSLQSFAPADLIKGYRGQNGDAVFSNPGTSVVQKSGPPTIADLASGQSAVFKDTVSGSVILAYNDAGTLNTAVLTPTVILNATLDNFATNNLFSGSFGPYWSCTNAWNLQGLTNYGLTITNNLTTFPNNTSFAWRFPVTPNNVSVWGYPEIVFGTQAGGAFSGGPANAPAPKTLNSLGTLSLTYNVNRASANADASLLIETWSQTSAKNPATNTHEILFYAFADTATLNFILGLTHAFDFSAGGLNAYVATSGTRIYMLPVTAPSGTTHLDMSRGTQTIDFAALLAALVTNTLVTGTNVISGYELGFEIASNAAINTVNSLNWTWR